MHLLPRDMEGFFFWSMKPVPVGVRFGHLVVLREAERDRRGHRTVECRCDCGAACKRSLCNLKTAVACSLRCTAPRPAPVGARFGSLVVLREVEPDYRGVRYVECQCDCGKTCRRRLNRLKEAVGCSYQCPVTMAAVSKHGYVHGLCAHPLYRVWGSMRRRCTDPEHPSWKDYGGRGIGVCTEWEKFSNFFRDMSPGYVKGLFIDRIDNNRGYAKENCRWVTRNESNRNKRNSVTPGWVLDAAAEIGLSSATVLRRIKRGWDLSRACTEPVQTKYRNLKSHSTKLTQALFSAQR